MPAELIFVWSFRGAEISAESAKTLLSGGIEFATPTEAGAPASQWRRSSAFTTNRRDAWKTWLPAIHLNLTNEVADTNKPAGLSFK